MGTPANDDLRARAEAFRRRGEELRQWAAHLMTADDQARFLEAGVAHEAEGRELIRLQAEEIASLEEQHAAQLRQLQARGFPTVRRVIADTNGNWVIF